MLVNWCRATWSEARPFSRRRGTTDGCGGARRSAPLALKSSGDLYGRARTGTAWSTSARVSASTAVNVMAAAPGRGTRLVAAWPAVALLLVVEALASTGGPVAGTGQPPVSTGQAGETPQVPPVPGPVPPQRLPGRGPCSGPAPAGPAVGGWRVPHDAGQAPAPDTEPAARAGQRVRRPAEETRRRAEEILADGSGLSRAQLARWVGISARRLREILAAPSAVSEGTGQDDQSVTIETGGPR
jgi:hypothetical protein